MLKKCSRCKQEKPLDKFYKDKTHKNNVSSKCIDCHKEYLKLRKYDISTEQYSALLKKQNGVCAICGQKETETANNQTLPLAIDHNHHTNQTRGLLCNKCNQGLGCFKDNEQILKRAIAYLHSFVKQWEK